MHRTLHFHHNSLITVAGDLRAGALRRASLNLLGWADLFNVVYGLVQRFSTLKQWRDSGPTIQSTAETRGRPNVRSAWCLLAYNTRVYQLVNTLRQGKP